ncbi:MAG: FliH/SctL family protein [Planctomycetota bacterium]|nr:FliH/SctL family protein [Planctomycetota bacterium]
MPLIRNQNATHYTHQAVALELENVRSEAQDLIESARAEAESIIARARGEAIAEQAVIRERAHAEGLQQGLEAGRASGHQAGNQQAYDEAAQPYQEILSKLAPAWLEQFEQFGQERERLFEEARRELVGFAVRLAERIVQRTIELDPTVCVDQVDATLKLLGSPSRIQLRINPADRELVDRALPGLLELASVTRDLDLIDDPSITRGGCIVATPEGTIDSTIEGQLDRVMEALVPGGDV